MPGAAGQGQCGHGGTSPATHRSALPVHAAERAWSARRHDLLPGIGPGREPERIQQSARGHDPL